jgi:hypothetical protein
MSEAKGNDGLAITLFFLAFIGIICAVVIPGIVAVTDQNACNDVCAPLAVMDCFDYNGNYYAACSDLSVRQIEGK